MNFNIKIKIRLGRRRTHVFKPSFFWSKSAFLSIPNVPRVSRSGPSNGRRVCSEVAPLHVFQYTNLQFDLYPEGRVKAVGGKKII